MELFEAMRREYEFGLGTIQGIARKFGVHRRMVREAVQGPIPTEKPVSVRPHPRLDPLAGFIDAILEADRRAPRKQRHTAHRIYVRIGQERPECVIAESTVRRYVRSRKLALGLIYRETFVPQSYPWGSEAQVDWYEAAVDLDGVWVTVQVFVIRSMASGAAFHRAYLRATQQAFLEAHQSAFHYFGGVFHRLRYDNLPAAVKRILRGFQREETARFVAFRSHWRFQAEFTNPGEGHEKGGVENEVGTFRRNHLVPVPQASDLAVFNEQLMHGCREDEGRVLEGRERTVGAALLIECDHLLPLAAEDFDLTETCFPTVTDLGTVKVRTNAYSVPARPGTTVQAKVTPTTIELWHEGKPIAAHERCYGRHQEILELEHYLDVLEHKPGAFAGSKPLEQWRKQGRWPTSYDRFWEGLIARLGKPGGTKEMIGLLLLGRTHGQEKLRAAIETALQLGCQDSAAVRHLLTRASLHKPPAEPLDLGPLIGRNRPLPDLGAYDQLLTQRDQSSSLSATGGAR